MRWRCPKITRPLSHSPLPFPPVIVTGMYGWFCPAAGPGQHLLLTGAGADKAARGCAAKTRVHLVTCSHSKQGGDSLRHPGTTENLSVADHPEIFRTLVLNLRNFTVKRVLSWPSSDHESGQLILGNNIRSAPSRQYKDISVLCSVFPYGRQ